MSTNLNLSVILRAVDHLSGPLRQMNSQLAAMQAPVRNLGAALNQSMQLTGITRMRDGLAGIGREARSLGFKLMAMGGTVGYGFKKMFVDTAAQFETFKITLMTFYDTSEKADAAMEWISAFAAKTPYELAEVTQGFIELKAFGLDPISGAMKAAGDAAAGMGKPLSEATRTLASAMRGQAEMLDNFGIFGRIEKNKMIMEGVYKDGKKFKYAIDKQNRELIASTIVTIWSKKYGDSMDRLSAGWKGTASNIADSFTRLSNKLMTSGGAFAFLEDELKGFLARIEYFQTPEGLKETAIYGAKLKEMLKAIKAYAGEAWVELNKLKASVGGWGNLAKLAFGSVALIMAGPLLLAITNVAAGMIMLASAFAANPVLLAVGLMVAAVVMLWKNWNQVVEGFNTGINAIKKWLTEGLMTAIDNVVGGIKLAFSAIVDGVAGVGRAIANIAQLKSPFSGGQPMFPSVSPTDSRAPNAQNIFPSTSSAMGMPVSLISSASPRKADMGSAEVYGILGNFKIDTGGELKITIDDQRTRVSSLKSNDPRQTINVDTGAAMVHAR